LLAGGHNAATTPDLAQAVVLSGDERRRQEIRHLSLTAVERLWAHRL